MRAFFEAGGRLVDSSPMYGSSQGVVGDGLRALSAAARVLRRQGLDASDGAAQVETSRGLWQVPRFDLLQVHNLLAWEKQLPLLQR
jgi:diketogulonate reductase-like aldo/keto reductase